MAHLYVADGLESTEVGSTITLRGSEARHAVSVSRLRVGESTLVTNGLGLLTSCETRTVGKDFVDFEVISLSQVEPQSPSVTLVQALAKGDRDERAIEMATELGVTAIVPWHAARSVSRWEGPKADKGRERWQSIVREASKQSVRAWIPVVAPVASTADLVVEGANGLTIVLDPSGKASLGQVLAEVTASQAQPIRIIVGPEGGLTSEELATLVQSGSHVVGLGSNILRTSTAGPAALAVLNEVLARW